MSFFAYGYSQPETICQNIVETRNISVFKKHLHSSNLKVFSDLICWTLNVSAE